MDTYISLVMFALFCLPFTLLPIANSISFRFSGFNPNSSNIHYQGDAIYTVGKVEFNKVNYINHVGVITYGKKVCLWDKKSGNISDFSTKFTFVIDTLEQPSGEYGHGITFFIAPAGFQIPLNSAGGFLGLFNTTTSHSLSNKMIVVEFDSFSNPEWDPSYEHVGININSIKSAVTTRWNATLHSGVPADVSIIYDATTKNLSVFWSYSNEPKKINSLSYPIDLMQVIPEWVSIGFSAATGRFTERHILESWEFYSSLNITEDEALRKDNSDDLQIKIKFSKLGLVLVSLGVFLFFLGGIIVLFFLCRKRKMPRLEYAEDTSFNEELERGAGPRRFSYVELASATQNFSNERKLGEGGFGSVYKGYLMDLDMLIAVKKFSRGGRQGKKEYSTEVKIISRLRCRNLVQLIGWCHDKGEFLLVYEYMPNGSLDCHLFGNKPPLSWPARYNIALGLASGLFYLHEEWEQCVVHRDIKSSNIMLDSNFNVKLGDFGLATLMQHGHSAQTITLAGTFGYMAPEYLSTGKASKESDVYSFGVVALEIATGRRSTDLMEAGTHQGKGLIQWVWDLYGNGELHLATDQKLKHMEFDAKQIECLMLLGLWCAYPDYNHRPSIKQAIQVLNFETIMPSLPPKMPVPIYQVPMMPTDSSSSGPSMLTSSVEFGR